MHHLKRDADSLDAIGEALGWELLATAMFSIAAVFDGRRVFAVKSGTGV